MQPGCMRAPAAGCRGFPFPFFSSCLGRVREKEMWEHHYDGRPPLESAGQARGTTGMLPCRLLYTQTHTWGLPAKPRSALGFPPSLPFLLSWPQPPGADWLAGPGALPRRRPPCSMDDLHPLAAWLSAWPLSSPDMFAGAKRRPRQSTHSATTCAHVCPLRTGTKHPPTGYPRPSVRRLPAQRATDITGALRCDPVC